MGIYRHLLKYGAKALLFSSGIMFGIRGYEVYEDNKEEIHQYVLQDNNLTDFEKKIQCLEDLVNLDER